MEWSQLDNVRGKRFWSGNTPEAPSFPKQYYPAHGVIAKENGVETLTVYFFCETFDNGADIYVRTKFTEGKPYEFELTTYTTEESDELNRFILTATMGNKARLGKKGFPRYYDYGAYRQGGSRPRDLLP